MPHNPHFRFAEARRQANITHICPQVKEERYGGVRHSSGTQVNGPCETPRAWRRSSLSYSSRTLSNWPIFLWTFRAIFSSWPCRNGGGQGTDVNLSNSPGRLRI